jgi:hypothetical protein
LKILMTRTRGQEAERILALGAPHLVDHRRPDGSGWITLAGPEGREFCMLPKDPAGLWRHHLTTVVSRARTSVAPATGAATHPLLSRRDWLPLSSRPASVNDHKLGVRIAAVKPHPHASSGVMIVQMVTTSTHLDRLPSP